MPIVPILLFIAIAIISSVAKANEQQKKQQAAQQRRQAYPPVHTAPASSAAPAAAPASSAGIPRPASSETEAQRRARQEELKRRLEENRARREQEQTRTAGEQRRPLEKAPMLKTIQTARAEKPIAEHTDDDCGGGSIHDGYHEGVTQFPNGRPAAVAGRLGNRLADEDERIEREHVAAENAKRAMKRISKLPPLAQGMVYSEILGKPKSETA